MEEQTILDRLDEKVSQVLEQYNALVEENEIARNELVTLRAENELKDKEIERLSEENSMKDLEIEDIVNKIESILA